MKWTQPLFVAVVIGLVGVGDSVAAAEPLDEVRQAAQELVDDSDPDLSSTALVATGRVGTAEQQQQLEVYQTATGQQERLATAAAMILANQPQGPSFASEQLLEATDTDEALRRLGAYLSADQLRRVLDDALDEAEGAERRAILFFMAHHRGPLYEALTRRLTDADEDLREAALEAVAHTAHEDTLDVAGELVNHHDAQIRRQMLDITEALNHRADLRSSIVDLLEGAVDDSSQSLRKEAARQLVELGQQSGADALAGMLADADSEQRVEQLEFLLDHNATANLDTIRPIIDEVEMDTEEDRQRERKLLYEFAATDADDEFFGQLREHLSSTIFDDRLVAVRSLGRTDREQARHLLTDTLGEGRADIRRYSARGLGHIADPDSLSDLRGQLNTERDDDVRLELIEAVGQIRDTQSIQVLQFLSTDTDPVILAAVVDALQEIGLPEGTRLLERLIQRRDRQLQWHAFQALLDIDADAAQSHTASVLRNPPDGFELDLEPDSMSEASRTLVYEALLGHGTNRVRSAGLNHVAAHRDTLMPVAREVVTDPDLHEEARVELVHLIAAQGDDDLELFERIVSRFSGEEAAQRAAWQLIERGDDEFVAIFQELADSDDEHPVLSMIAKLAIAELD